MKPNAHHRIEHYRVTSGPFGSTREYGNTGLFHIPFASPVLRVLASDGTAWPEEMGSPAWEHVSVSRPDRCPSWEDMDRIKQIFWADDETVLQFHVPRQDHINNHPYCLHLWKPIGVEVPRPPVATVGIKGVEASSD